jgi:ABC-2 type transport system ATP-binding protein
MSDTPATAVADALVIETHGLTRYFGRKKAVDSLDLAVPRGCVYAMLGRNGSGKTTTIRMLLGLLEPTRGTAKVLGQDSRDLPPSVRGRIGYMSESHAMYRWMRVREAGEFQRQFYPRWNDTIFRAVVDHFRLDPKAKAADLSRGERAGLSLALTLAPEPELLILDDPALGLDPVARRSLLESMVYVTRRADRTILFSSHLLSDVERVADYIGIMDRSVLKAQCPIDMFLSRVSQFVLRFAASPPELPKIRGLLHARRAVNELRVVVANADDETQRVLRSLGALSVEQSPVGFEDAVIGYLGDRGTAGFFLHDLASAQPNGLSSTNGGERGAA